MSDFITACLICRDSEASIEKCLKSLKGVDFINITDTGSKDKTKAIIKDVLRGQPHKLTDFEWVDNFAAARNFNMAQAPPETTWLFWCDSDDEIQGTENIHEVVKAMPDDVGAVWLLYNYARDEFGNPVTVFERERILRAKYGWLWRSRIHETVQPMTACKYVRDPRIVVNHNHSGTSRSRRNFALLEKTLKEEPENKRIWLYMGHQHFAEQGWGPAAEWYLKFASAPDVVPIERYQAQTYAARALRSLGMWQQAINCDLAALEAYPDWVDAYVGLSATYLQIGEYAKAVHWGNEGKTRREPEKMIFINPLEKAFNLPMQIAEAHARTGNLKAAEYELQQAFQVRPIKEVKESLAKLQALSRQEEVKRGLQALSLTLLDSGELVKLKKLPDVLPYWLQGTDFWKAQVGGTNFHTKDMKDEPVVIEDGDKVLIRLDNALKPEELLAKYDDKALVTVVANGVDKAIRRFGIQDMERLVASKPGRRIIDLQVAGNGQIECRYDHQQPAPDSLVVRMWVGQGLEYWSPKTIKETGCGGSETAAAYTAMEFAKEGHLPLVYAMDGQVWNGAIFRLHQGFRPETPECDLFISSRQPDLLHLPLNAKQKWLLVHDVHCGDRLTPEVANRCDAIVALSHWHAGFLKRTYPWLADCEVLDFDSRKPSYEDDVTAITFYPEAKLYHKPILAIIGDGIDTERFEKLDVSHKRPHSFIWASSPDRGLKELLGMWPAIRHMWADARLDIFYGWEYFDHSLHIPGQADFKQDILGLIRQEGVNWRGRVGQQQLALEMARSEIWLYPPHDFRETYCISSQEMQAAGVLCFYRENGALGETVGPERGIPIPLSAGEKEIVQILERVLSDSETCARLKASSRTFGLLQSWNAQVKKMIALYRTIEERRNGQIRDNRGCGP